MLKDVVEVRYQSGHSLYLRFEDGAEGIIDIGQIIEFTGVFAPLQDEQNLARVQLNPEWGTICWDSGADLDPDVLYAAVTGQPIRDDRLSSV